MNRKDELKRTEKEEAAKKNRKLVEEMVRTGDLPEMSVQLRDEYFEAHHDERTFLYCAACGVPVAGRLQKHMKTSNCKGNGLSLEKKNALLFFGKNVSNFSSRACIDLSSVVPSTAGEYQIARQLLKMIEAGGVPIKGVLVRPAQQASSSLSVEKISDSLRQVMRAELRSQGSQGSQQQPAVDYPCPERDEALTKRNKVPTADANCILPREECMLSTRDDGYKGGSYVHPLFKEHARRELMFEHKYDSAFPNYWSMSYATGSRKDLEQAEKALQIWRKIDTANQLLLEEYKGFLEKTTRMSSLKTNRSLVGIGKYLPYVQRYMMAVMRSRRRLGQPVSVDDVIFSNDVVFFFFEQLRLKGVKYGVAQQFNKALLHFLKYLNLQVPSFNMTGDRNATLKQFSDRLLSINRQLKKDENISHFQETTGSKPKKISEKYGVIRAIIDHKAVDEKIIKIANEAKKLKPITRAQYDFLMGAIMSRIIHFNTVRNECCYKMTYGSVCQLEQSGAKDTLPGMLKIERRIEGTMETFHVGTYPDPKQGKGMRQRSAIFSGLFVVDEKMNRWLDVYKDVRKRILLFNKRAGCCENNSQFFIKYDGTPIADELVIHYMAIFFRCVRQEHRNISCTLTRTYTASKEFDVFCSKLLDEGTDKDTALLAGHDPSTRLKIYNKKLCSAAVSGYIKLKQISDEDQAEFAEQVAEINRKMEVVGLTDSELNKLLEQEEALADPEGVILENYEGSDSEEDDAMQRDSREEDAQRRRSSARVTRGPLRGNVFQQLSSEDSSSCEDSEDDYKPKKKTGQQPKGKARRRTEGGSEIATTSRGHVDSDDLMEHSEHQETDPFVFQSDDDSAAHQDVTTTDQAEDDAAPARDEQNNDEHNIGSPPKIGSVIEGMPEAPAKRHHSPSAPTPRKMGYKEVPAPAVYGSMGDLAPLHMFQKPAAEAEPEDIVRSWTKSALLHEQNEQPTIEKELDDHNKIECSEYDLPSNIYNEDTWNELDRRRKNIPVQAWNHLAVLNADPCGKGVFAKCDIPKNAIICDYRGLLITEKEHLKRLHNPKISNEVKDWVRAYRLEINIPPMRSWTKSALLHEQNEQPTIEKELDDHNKIECSEYDLPSNIYNEDTWNELDRRRKNIPVQAWNHLAVLNADPCGKGVFAKCDIPKNAIICDYRGLLITEKEHLKRLHNPKISNEVKDWVRAYRLEINIPPIGTHIMEAHCAKYQKSVVIGRFINHTPHRKCVNVKPRFVRIKNKTSQANVVFFNTVRPIKKHEQLLWDYGKLYNDFPWYNKCPNVNCQQPAEHLPELTEMDAPLVEHQYVSSSQDPLGTTVSLSQSTTSMEPVSKLRAYMAMTAVMKKATVNKMKIKIIPGNDISLVVQTSCSHFGHRRNPNIAPLSEDDGSGMLPEIFRKLCKFAHEEEKNICFVMMSSLASPTCTMVVMNGTTPGGPPFCMVGWLEASRQMFTVAFHSPGVLDTVVPAAGELICFKVRSAPIGLMDECDGTIEDIVKIIKTKFTLL